MGFFCAGAPLVFAQSVPTGGTALLSEGSVAQAGFYGGGTAAAPVATRQIVTVAGQPFGEAARVATLSPTGESYTSAMTFSSNRAVAEGDVVLLRFWVRSIETTDETGTVTMEAYVEGPGPAYTRSTSYQVNASSAWQEFFLPFRVVGSYPAGQLGFKFGFGATGRPQVLEMGGVEAWWYGTSRRLDEMPRTSFNYVGRDAGAAWRAAAAARINQYRKNRYEVRAVDADGQPVAGRRLRVRLTRHAFEFGTAMVASRLMDPTGADNARYREKLRELFNAGTFENDTKWPPWDGEWGAGFNRTQTLAALEWTKANRLTMRGHVLVWPSVRNLPNSIGPLVQAGDATVPERVRAHIEEMLTATAGGFVDWDVLNEPYDNFDLMRVYGYERMADWFKEARRHAPAVGLFINDYGILSGGGLNVTKQDAYAATIRRILNEGGPLTGIGFQGHFSGTPTSIPRVWEILERYATAFPGAALRITEFDIGGNDPALQADYLRDFYTLCFSHPRMIGVQAWGFWEEAHWRPESAFYASDWTERPIGRAYRELVHGAWRTDDAGVTGPDGRMEGRGFHGEYVIEDESGRELGTFVLGPDAAVSRQVTVAAAGEPDFAFVRQPLGALVAPGATVTLRAEAAGRPAPTLTWRREGGGQVGTGNTLELANVGAAEAGRYYAVATRGGAVIESRRVAVGVRAAGAPATEKLINISTRARVQTGTGKLVAGFVIQGDRPKDVVIRAVGPRLATFGVPGVLADPEIALFRAGTATPLAEADGWAPELAADFAALGAFDLAGDARSAALRASLPPGAYTVVVGGVGNTTGVALVEVYDAATGVPVEMINISTRGAVGTGGDVILAGFVIEGALPQRVLVRGVGPALARFGVGGVLQDPVLRLYEQVPGGGARLLRANGDASAAANAADIESATERAGGFPLVPGEGDAAMVVDLEPGAYTVELAGADGGTGIGLIEVYRLR